MQERGAVLPCRPSSRSPIFPSRSWIFLPFDRGAASQQTGAGKGIFIAESPTVIGLALAAGCQPLALLTERKFIEGKAAAVIARCGEIPVYTGEREVLSGLTGYALTRGVLCAMRRPAPLDCAALCAGARRVAVLENVVDSTNVGAIIRSAAALGIDAVLLTPTCCDPLNRRAVRVSMGTVFQIPWAYLDSSADYLPQLKAMGFRTAAMALREDSVPINDKNLAAEKSWRSFWAPRERGLPLIPSKTAIIRYEFPCSTAWIH